MKKRDYMESKMTNERQPLYIKVNPKDNVAIIVNQGGLSKGTVFSYILN